MNTSVNRRTALAAAAVAGSGLLGSRITMANTQQTNLDPAFSAIEARMTALDQRGTSLSVRQKHAVLLTVAATVGSPAPFFELTRKAIKDGVSPIEVKEILYQSAPYIGMARVAGILPEVNRALAALGVELPLPNQTMVTDDDRLEKGIAVQTAIFGEAIAKMHAAVSPEDRAVMIDDLSGWCFGDFYTRRGLSIADRELVTFIAIATLGGCEPQLRAHAAANAKEGNTRQNLIDALRIAVPYLGFPRTLNALAVVKEVVKA